MSKSLLSAKYCYNCINLHSAGDSVGRISNTLFRSKIELTPHQINAALFAFNSPFSKGVILADEVGLGKTIEAGIIISQYVYEHKSRILIISPASLQRQWENELSDKFGLKVLVLDRKAYNDRKKRGFGNPFDNSKNVIICSYQMCSSCCEEIMLAGLDLVVIDEAHKLRNVYGKKAITSKNILRGTQNYKKLLLTATPIQNSLMDLYGLSLFIDPEIFADKMLFKKKYINDFSINENELEITLNSFLHRTLRNQVNKYIKFTNRIPQTFSFHQTAQETKVYEGIRNLLLDADNNEYIIPVKQRHLLLLVLGKLMGSSMHAIVYTLKKIVERLYRIRETGILENADEDLFLDIEAEVEDDDNELSSDESDTADSVIDVEEIDKEIALLNVIIRDASSVQVESKYIALQNALSYSFQHLRELGAEEKVVIFTESRRTQEYLIKSLKKDGYKGVLSFNGTNTDIESKSILEKWCLNPAHNQFLGRNRAINTKSAILDEFRNNGQILVATEAGAEGLNLQFCSLVINYDLPWNPQRIEQRIGRCHRFGQSFDVVVINFINSDNLVEQRIYELLDTKYSLFREVLGSSDAVLGVLENGDNLAQSIIDIYTTCRSNEEINEAFDEMQSLYKQDISDSLAKTKQVLLDNFDEDLQNLFSSVMVSVNESIGEYERIFWQLTKSMLKDDALFDDTDYSFILQKTNQKFSLKHGNSSDCIPYGFDSDLGQKLICSAKNITVSHGHIEFNKSAYPFKISILDSLIGKTGYIIVKKLLIHAIENEEYLVYNAILDDGTRLDEDICKKLFRLDTAECITETIEDNQLIHSLKVDSDINVHRLIEESFSTNNDYVQKQIEKINKWADDKIQATQLSVDNMREERKNLQKESELASNFVEKKEIEERILKLSKKIKQSWLELANAEDDIEEQRKTMISEIKRSNYGQEEETVIILARFSVI